MKALGYYQQTPAARRHQAMSTAVTRLSLLAHMATIRAFTKGETLRCGELAAELRGVADDLDAVGLHLLDQEAA